jgi:hypothetical protein
MSLPVRKSAFFAWAGALVLLVVACLALFGRRTDFKTGTSAAGSQTATRPTTGPASKPAPLPEPKYVATFMDVVRSAFPAFPATAPLAMPLNLSEAARLIIKDPVYFDAPGSLIWITRPDAPPTEAFLKKPPDDPERVVVTREHVLYVHWLPDGGGVYWPFIIVPSADSASASAAAAGGYELVSHLGRQKIGSRQDYRWDRAMSWNEKLVVPTATGVSIFKFALDADGRPVVGPQGPEPVECFQDLNAPAPTSAAAEAVAPPSEFAEPQILLDWQGLLAFIPWDPGRQGGRGAARFINEKWASLGPEAGWPTYTLHLIPLFDGSVMQFVLTRPSDDDADAEPPKPASGRPVAITSDPHTWPVKLGVVDLDHAAIDAHAIKTLVARLGDADQAVRDAAFSDLSRYGPAICPILKDLFDDAAPEAQARMKQLLRSQAAPLLGGMSLLGTDIRLVCRNPDGSAVFYTDKGVQAAGPDGEPVVSAPAWLAIRPGHPVELLSPILTADLKPESARITPVIDEWVVVSDVRGPRRFIGNGFVNLLRKDEAEFSQVVGQDHRGRWLFRRPADPHRVAPGPESVRVSPPGTATAAAATASMPSDQEMQQAPGPGDSAETLIIDPTLPNLVPRLPVWNYTTAQEVGWERDDWPAVKQLNNVSRLTDNGWEVLSGDDPLLTRPDQAPALPGPPATQSSPILPLLIAPAGVPLTPATTTEASPSNQSQPATLPTPVPPTTVPDVAATKPAEVPIWVDRGGTRYFGGIDELRIASPSGKITNWTLPASATGKQPVHLIGTGDGRLFLFNQPGRVVRLKPTPDAPEPFTVEATFTRNLPNVDEPTRIWLDCAGRIIIAHDKSLAILFPAGYLPPRIRALMSDVDDQDDDSDRP